jgi:hypothetical protein
MITSPILSLSSALVHAYSKKITNGKQNLMFYLLCLITALLLYLRSASLYQGIFYAFAIIGPGAGYLLGGAFLNYYTDWDRITEE